MKWKNNVLENLKENFSRQKKKKKKFPFPITTNELAYLDSVPYWKKLINVLWYFYVFN